MSKPIDPRSRRNTEVGESPALERTFTVDDLTAVKWQTTGVSDAQKLHAGCQPTVAERRCLARQIA